MALNDNWNEVSGDWTVVSGRLYEPSSSPATIINKNPVPVDSAGEMHITVDICDPVQWNEYYIHLACTDTSGSGGEWVKFTYVSENNFLVTLSTGEFKTMTFDPPGGATVWQAEACIDSDGTMYGRIATSGSEYPWTDAAGTQNGRYHGLGHGVATATTIYFDNYSISELRNDPDEFCFECFCHCGDNNLKKELLLTIVNAVDRASCMNGRQVCMRWEWNGGTPWWASDVMTVYSQTSGSTASSTFKWILTCSNWDPANPFDNFSLSWASGYANCCTYNSGQCNGVFHPIDMYSTCNGLYLYFGTFMLSNAELSCNACWNANDPRVDSIPPGSPPPPLTGTYGIAITEGTCP